MVCEDLGFFGVFRVFGRCSGFRVLRLGSMVSASGLRFEALGLHAGNWSGLFYVFIGFKAAFVGGP